MPRPKKIKVTDGETRHIERRHPNVWDYKNRRWHNPCSRMNLNRTNVK
jgi:hypothetical protein